MVWYRSCISSVWIHIKESGISVSFTGKGTERPDSCCGFSRASRSKNAEVFLKLFKIYEEKNEKISEQDLHYEKETMITSLRLGIPEYDNINPLISNNREIINISPIIYEPLFTLDKTFKFPACFA